MSDHRGERGASAVEFAIIISLLFLLLFGIVQFGFAYHRYQGLQAGAREGARLAALPSATVAEIEGRVRESVSIIDMTAAESCPSPSAAGEYCIRVFTRPAPGGTLSADYTSLTAEPCQGKDVPATVIVEIQHRMQISIPLWASPTMTLTTHGEFQCEVGTAL